MENNNFLKVIYFDESFVADFMQIMAGGELKKTTEFILEVNSEMGAEVGVDGSVGTEKNGLSKIFSFLSGSSINLEAGAHANVARNLIKLQRILLKILFWRILLLCLMQIREELKINVVLE